MGLHSQVLSFHVAQHGAPNLHGITVHFGPSVPDVTAGLQLSHASPTLHVVGLVQVLGALQLAHAIPGIQMVGGTAIGCSVRTVHNAPVVFVRADYNNQVNRGVLMACGEPWQQASDRRATQNSGWQVSSAEEFFSRPGWQQGAPLRVAEPAPWQDSAPNKEMRAGPWQVAAQLVPAERLARHQEAEAAKSETGSGWQDGKGPVARTVASPYIAELTHIKPRWRTEWSIGRRLLRQRRHSWETARRKSNERKIPWGEGVVPRHGIPTKPPSPPGPVIPPPWDKRLRFICPWLDYGFHAVPIHFRRYRCAAEEGLVVPTLRLYMILNQISMRRVDDSTPIEVLSASLSADHESWCWTFSGSVPAVELDKVAPGTDGPVEVELTMNGLAWRFLIESYDRRRTFGNSAVSIRGRSVTALLDAPYAPLRSYAETEQLHARQLAEQELDRVPGAPFALDWPTVDHTLPRRRWQADDGFALGWLIPGGVFSYANLTPIQALNYLAQSVGSYLQSDPAEKTIAIASAYPQAPWEWSTTAADLSIPKSVLRADSLQWEERPQYNRVFVMGRESGISALVRHTDFVPDLDAPSYTHDLITDQYAARERGKTLLAAGGKQARVSIDVPLDPSLNLGIIAPGLLVRLTDSVTAEPEWMGIVRGVQLTAQGSEREITIAQSISIERHY